MALEPTTFSLSLRSCTVVVSTVLMSPPEGLKPWQPVIEVDSQTYQVRANGELLTCEPAEVLPMAQRYFLF